MRTEDDFPRDDASFDADLAIAALARDVLSGIKRVDFQQRARELAAGIEADDLNYLHSQFHAPPAEPPEYDFARHGLGGWLSACQFAIFELVFQLKAEAIPFLRKIAWGPYDWTQGNAIELLIRLAAENIETEEITAEIAANYPNIRYEAQLYTLEPLVPMAHDDAALAALLNRMRSVIPELDRVVREIENRQQASD